MADDHKLRKVAGILHAATIVAMGAIVVVMIVILVQSPPGAANAAVYFAEIPVAEMVTNLQFWAAFSLSLLSVILFLWILEQARRLFRHYRKGDVLTGDAVRYILRIGQGLLALAVLNIVSQPIQTTLLTWAAEAGERQVSVGLTSETMGFVLAGGLFTVIGWAMREAVRIADENRSFV